MAQPPFLQLALDERSTIARLDVIALGADVTTRSAVGPATLERIATHRAASADAAVIDETLRLLRDAEPAEDPGSIDARWGLAFVDGRDRRILAIYLDKFGNRGVIEGYDVRLNGSRLTAWLGEMFPQPLPLDD